MARRRKQNPMEFEEKLVELPFPLEGVDHTRALMKQRPLTAPDALNVRSFDPQTDRARGGSRPGLSRYVAGPGTAIQEIALFVSEAPVTGGLIAAGPGTAGTGANVITVANPGSQVTTVGASVSLTITATDSGGGTPFSWSAQGLPSGLSINASTGIISGTAQVTQTCTIVVTMTDSAGSKGSATFTWFVTTTTSGRSQLLVFVAGGSIYQAIGGGYSSLGAGLSAAAPVVFSAPCQQQLFLCDGTSYRYFAAWAGTVSAWTASHGTLPVDNAGNKARLICTWNGRVVLSGLLNDGANWFMSAQLDPFNFDYSPQTQVSTQAVAGNNAPAGTLGDIVMCLLPYSDSLLLFGCSHSIWLLTGDPMSGGSITNVSQSLGMQWGRPYAIDTYGQIFFVGSDRGIYKLVPGALPVRISQAITRDLQNLVPYDPLQPANGQVLFRLAWDTYNQGLWVFCSVVGGGSAATHFFWEERTNAWWPQQFFGSGCDPFATLGASLDDHSDQVLLIGGSDGCVRNFDDTASTDDGQAITSSVVLGPLQTKELDDVMLKTLLATLAADAGTVTWAVYVGPDAETALASTAVATGTWSAGRNPLEYVRFAGIQVYVKLTSSAAWSLEKIEALYAPTGRTRRRLYDTQTIALPSPTANLSAAPTVVSLGASSLLTWSSSNSVTVTLNGALVAASGTQSVTPSAATTYTLVVTGLAGTTPAQVQATVSIAAPTASITALPPSLAAGQTVTVTWSSTNGTSITLNGVAVAASGTQFLQPSVTTTYTLLVTGPGGSANASASVTVLAPGSPPIGAIIQPRGFMAAAAAAGIAHRMPVRALLRPFFKPAAAAAAPPIGKTIATGAKASQQAAQVRYHQKLRATINKPAAVTAASNIVVRQTLAAAAQSGSNLSLVVGTFGQPLNNPSTIIVCIWSNDYPHFASSVTDTAGNTYTPDKQFAPPSLPQCEIWRAQNASATASNQITVTFPAIGFFSACALEVTGLSGVVDVTVTNSGTNNGSAPTAGSFSTTNANDLILLTLGDYGTLAATAPSGYTRFAALLNHGNGDDGAAAYKIVSATQSNINPAWVVTSNTNGWNCIAIAYKGS